MSYLCKYFGGGAVNCEPVSEASLGKEWREEKSLFLTPYFLEIKLQRQDTHANSSRCKPAHRLWLVWFGIVCFDVGWHGMVWYGMM